MVPAGGGPASVRPRCSGYGLSSAANLRLASSVVGTSDALRLTLIMPMPKSQDSRILMWPSAARTIRSAVSWGGRGGAVSSCIRSSMPSFLPDLLLGAGRGVGCLTLLDRLAAGVAGAGHLVGRQRAGVDPDADADAALLGGGHHLDDLVAVADVARVEAAGRGRPHPAPPAPAGGRSGCRR